MMDDSTLEAWFCREILPLERALMHFIRRNWRNTQDIADLRNDIYELVIAAARRELPVNPRQYVYVVARNHLINRAKRAQIVSIELVADLEAIEWKADLWATENALAARDALRRVQAGLDRLSPRVRQIVILRKIEGLTVAETAVRLGIGKDAVNRQLAMGVRALADFMLGGSGKIQRHRRVASSIRAKER